VKVGGGLEDEVQVDIDQQKLAQLNLPIDTVIQRLQQENINISGGRLEEGSQRFLVRTVNQFATVDEIREMLVREWSALAERRHVRAHVVDPDTLRVALVGLSAGEEEDVGLHALRVEDPGGQAQ